ncbi:hypothetical protein BDZ85DRAFT_316616 [Elsinoe ampelina]|uniref:3'-5' exonuclease domain-containing protein n=1 Tax=Elsinoe ampelina TaxID=302913 RepID=A0A6A6GIZ8_9PEZI|nr:hypothetical protein BDZ85DRAFT_316616 [Elsinoe ampelina]
MAIYLVDTPDALQCLLSVLADHPPDQPIYLATTPQSLDPDRPLSLLQIHLTTTEETFIIDVLSLRGATSTTSPHGTSLASILASPTTTKIFFDARYATTVLRRHFGVSLANAVEVQVMQARLARATFGGSERLLPLQRCVMAESAVSKEEKRVFRDVVAERGGWTRTGEGKWVGDIYARPVKEVVLGNAVVDVVYLPGLYEGYDGRMTKELWEEVERGTKERTGVGRDVAMMRSATGNDMATSGNDVEDARVAKEKRGEPTRKVSDADTTLTQSDMSWTTNTEDDVGCEATGSDHGSMIVGLDAADLTLRNAGATTRAQAFQLGLLSASEVDRYRSTTAGAKSADEIQQASEVSSPSEGDVGDNSSVVVGLGSQSGTLEAIRQAPNRSRGFRGRSIEETMGGDEQEQAVGRFDGAGDERPRGSIEQSATLGATLYDRGEEAIVLMHEDGSGSEMEAEVKVPLKKGKGGPGSSIWYCDEDCGFCGQCTASKEYL